MERLSEKLSSRIRNAKPLEFVWALILIGLLVMLLDEARAGFTVPPKREQERVKALIRSTVANPWTAEVLVAMARVESFYDAKARGLQGEIGLFQIKLSTAKYMRCANDERQLFTPRVNIRCAEKYFDYLRSKVHMLESTLVSYNRGPDGARLVENHMNDKYVLEVFRHLGI